VHLQKRNALRDQKERKSKLTKYIPDVTRSLYELLNSIKKRRQEQADEPDSPRKRPRANPFGVDDMIAKLDKKEVTQELIKQRLEAAVNLQNSMEEVAAASENHKTGIPLYIKPLFDMGNAENDIDHPLFTFRPIEPVTP
jgi:hypothetical protein